MKLWNNLELTNPGFLWLLLLIPVLAVWYFFIRKTDSARLKISSTKGFPVSWWSKLKPLLYALRLLALAFLVLAMTGPRNVEVTSKVKTTKGIDIVMAMDISSSMLARDLRPNRLEALKNVAIKFVNERPNDRIGLVVYAGESYTKTPITSDKRVIINAIRQLRFGEINDGTAIGMGLGTAINRLKESKAKSKVIILMTDGVNNSGFIDPKTAAELAKELGIKVYTIGIGTNGVAPFPVRIDDHGNYIYGNVQVEIDEAILKYIAKETGGEYFRATGNEKLASIYDEINKLEKTDIQEFKYYNYEDKYRPLVLLAGLLVVLEVLMRLTLFRSLT
ncbi:MAG: VWA domain-containing protein [Flavobacteriaceae bacterium]|nr:VWA domain-containing protein [Flavobacteriaceae bacterium]